MPKTKKRRSRKTRPIDVLANGSKSWWQSNFVFMNKGRVRAWQIIVVACFLIGALTALVVSVHYQVQIKSNASTSIVPISNVSEEAQKIQNWGWDNNLTKRCAKTPYSQNANYFEDATQCSSDGMNWVVAVESETSAEKMDSCPGSRGQSFQINGNNSPTTMNWIKHKDEFGNDNWSVNMKTNFGEFGHPCMTENQNDITKGYYTWYTFMDHKSYNKKPFPRTDKLVFDATVNYNDWTPNGSARAFVVWSAFWNGKLHSIEFNFQVSNQLFDGHPDPDVIVRIPDAVKGTTEFVAIDASKEPWNMKFEKMKDNQIHIDWYKIVQNMIDRGLLEKPEGGWESTETISLGIGHETYNYTKKNAVIADMYFTNFRISEKEEQPQQQCKNIELKYGSADYETYKDVRRNSKFTYACDYGFRSNAIFPESGAGNCQWTAWDGTAAVFECETGSKRGTFPYYCVLGNMEPDHFCPRRDLKGNIRVK